MMVSLALLALALGAAALVVMSERDAEETHRLMLDRLPKFPRQPVRE